MRAPGPLQRVLEACHYYVGALPGVIVALALVTITVRVALPLYQTLATLLLAYVLMFLPRALVGLAHQHRPGAGRAGAGGDEPGPPAAPGDLETTMRLAAPGAAASAALVALGIANELTGTLMLAPNGTRTLATRFWSYTSELDYASAAPYALMMVVMSLPLVLLLKIEAERVSGS